ncbi:MAG: hypothetical protein P1U46_01090 [Patescibacteria group bacterium]|nr:hypothetical protein [Patescibacteria group bacterium]
MNLKKYSIYTKQLIDGMPSPIFSSSTFPPNKKHKDVFMTRYKKILSVSREKYSKDRKQVEDRIYKTIDDIDIQEKLWEKKKEEYKQKEKEEKDRKRIEAKNKQ